MNVPITFLYTFTYLKMFYLRRDWHLFMFSVCVAIYTVTYLAGFLFIFSGFKGIIASEPLVSVGFDFLPQYDPESVLYGGIVVFGASIVFYFGALLAAIRSGANFGADFVYKFEPRWDSLKLTERKNIVQAASFASRLARPVLNSLVPLVTFVAGVVYLGTINPWIAPGAILIGGLALFGFIPANIINEKLSRTDFSPQVNRETLNSQRPDVIRFMAQKFSMYRARKIISGMNFLILFVLILGVTLVIGPREIVALFDEQVVILLVVARTSVLSLTRLTFCLRIVNSNLPMLNQIFGALKDGTVPKHVDATETDDGD